MKALFKIDKISVCIKFCCSTFSEEGNDTQESHPSE
jgi:hypothetical protein